MREAFDSIKKSPHPEEAAKRLSRRKHGDDPAGFDFFTNSKVGVQGARQGVGSGFLLSQE
jgi:hypothetical protein